MVSLKSAGWLFLHRLPRVIQQQLGYFRLGVLCSAPFARFCSLRVYPFVLLEYGWWCLVTVIMRKEEKFDRTTVVIDSSDGRRVIAFLFKYLQRLTNYFKNIISYQYRKRKALSATGYLLNDYFHVNNYCLKSCLTSARQAAVASKGLLFVHSCLFVLPSFCP